LVGGAGPAALEARLGTGEGKVGAELLQQAVDRLLVLLEDRAGDGLQLATRLLLLVLVVLLLLAPGGQLGAQVSGLGLLPDLHVAEPAQLPLQHVLAGGRGLLLDVGDLLVRARDLLVDLAHGGRRLLEVVEGGLQVLILGRGLRRIGQPALEGVAQDLADVPPGMLKRVSGTGGVAQVGQICPAADQAVVGQHSLLDAVERVVAERLVQGVDGSLDEDDVVAVLGREVVAQEGDQLDLLGGLGAERTGVVLLQVLEALPQPLLAATVEVVLDVLTDQLVAALRLALDRDLEDVDGLGRNLRHRERVQLAPSDDLPRLADCAQASGPLADLLLEPVLGDEREELVDAERRLDDSPQLRLQLGYVVRRGPALGVDLVHLVRERDRSRAHHDLVEVLAVLGLDAVAGVDVLVDEGRVEYLQVGHGLRPLAALEAGVARRQPDLDRRRAVHAERSALLDVGRVPGLQGAQDAGESGLPVPVVAVDEGQPLELNVCLGCQFDEPTDVLHLDDFLYHISILNMLACGPGFFA